MYLRCEGEKGQMSFVITPVTIAEILIFLINLNMEILKCSMCIGCPSKTLHMFLYKFQDMYKSSECGFQDKQVPWLKYF